MTEPQKKVPHWVDNAIAEALAIFRDHYPAEYPQLKNEQDQIENSAGVLAFAWHLASTLAKRKHDFGRTMKIHLRGSGKIQVPDRPTNQHAHVHVITCLDDYYYFGISPPRRHV